MTVRRLGVEEAAVLRDIRLAALAGAPEAFGSTLAREQGQPLEFFATRLAGGAIFISEHSGEVVGMAGLRQAEGEKERHKAMITGVFVRPEARGRGFGAALIGAALAHARGMVEQVHLAVVQGNASALALYERLGFVAYGVEPRALRMGAEYFDEVLMVKVF